MADEKIIRALKAEAALDSTYSRAMRLARGKGVLHMAKRAGTVGSTIGLAGRVKGSDGSYYSVTVDLDVSSGEVLDYSCTCPAAARYLGMCKHEIALALVSLGGVPAGERPRRRPAVCMRFRTLRRRRQTTIACKRRGRGRAAHERGHERPSRPVHAAAP